MIIMVIPDHNVNRICVPARNCVDVISFSNAFCYYIRGSYQVLAIGLQVGWHPHYKALLQEEE